MSAPNPQADLEAAQPGAQPVYETDIWNPLARRRSAAPVQADAAAGTSSRPLYPTQSTRSRAPTRKPKAGEAEPDPDQPVLFALNRPRRGSTGCRAGPATRPRLLKWADGPGLVRPRSTRSPPDPELDAEAEAEAEAEWADNWDSADSHAYMDRVEAGLEPELEP